MRRIKGRNVGDGKGPHRKAPEVQTDKVPHIPVFRSQCQDPGVGEKQDVCGKAKKRDQKHRAFDADAVKVCGNDARERHIDHQAAHRVESLRL